MNIRERIDIIDEMVGSLEKSTPRLNGKDLVKNTKQLFVLREFSTSLKHSIGITTTEEREHERNFA